MTRFFYALEVADAGSFSQAARNLYLSQPNLSYAVRQLEKDLDVQLFHRVPGGVVPTEDGQELIERFRIIRREYEQIQSFSELPHRDFRQQLRIGSLHSSRAARAFSGFVKNTAEAAAGFPF
ncbi:MAG: LysR family transcriptional regulator [Eubacteriales bacterium]